MASNRKRKRKDDPTLSVRSLSFNNADLSDTEDSAEIIQTNVIVRVAHNTRGRTTTQTLHTSFSDDEELPDLDAIYGALASTTTSYGNEGGAPAAPLDDDDISHPFFEHQLESEDDTTVSLLCFD